MSDARTKGLTLARTTDSAYEAMMFLELDGYSSKEARSIIQETHGVDILIYQYRP